jgi:hypothetical protein
MQYCMHMYCKAARRLTVFACRYLPYGAKFRRGNLDCCVQFRHENAVLKYGGAWWVGDVPTLVFENMKRSG